MAGLVSLLAVLTGTGALGAEPAPVAPPAGADEVRPERTGLSSEDRTSHAFWGPDAEQTPDRLMTQVGRMRFSAGGLVLAGMRKIQADRATGNESTPYYELDLHGEARFDEEIGARIRTIFRPPVSQRARSHELFDEINDPFELREVFLFFEGDTAGRLSFGKLKLPFGPADRMEDEPWNQPLLEYYIARTGSYDIGARWDRAWLDGLLHTAFACTGGNTGALDTNSAVAASGEITLTPVAWCSFGAWGKLNAMDTTPIKRDDNAVGLFARLEYRNWRLLGKYAWLKQGFRDTDFTAADLDAQNYDDDESDVLLWLRDNGGESRTIECWYVLISAPAITDIPFFGRRIERLDLFGHFGQAADPTDPYEYTRDRLGLGANMLLRDTGTARLSLAGGATFDDDTSNTRPYLDRRDEINERNDRLTYWVTLTLEF